MAARRVYGACALNVTHTNTRSQKINHDINFSLRTIFLDSYKLLSVIVKKKEKKNQNREQYKTLKACAARESNPGRKNGNLA